MQIWDYNDKFYLKINDIKQLKSYLVNIPFKKTCLILWISLLENMTFKRMVSRLQVTVFLKLVQSINLLYIYIYIYIEMGLPESALKPFSFFKSL